MKSNFLAADVGQKSAFPLVFRLFPHDPTEAPQVDANQSAPGNHGEPGTERIEFHLGIVGQGFHHALTRSGGSGCGVGPHQSGEEEQGLLQHFERRRGGGRFLPLLVRCEGP